MVTVIGGGHSLPEPARVPSLVLDFVHRANSYRADYLHQAAYALWRVNWIHPFAGGNGRTARALSYLLLCMHEGFMLPGVPTVPTIIATTLRRHYLPALKQADEAQARGEEDLERMKAVLARALERQFTAALEQANRDIQALSLEAEKLSRERGELRSQFARELTAARSALGANIEDRLDDLVNRAQRMKR
jgi:Fic family protein